MKKPLRPDDESKPFIARWNALARILLVESSVKLVARAAMDYADFEDGTECYPSNERIARETGYCEKTVRIAWGVLRGLGMAERVEYAVAHEHRADKYELCIPDNWATLPVLGPSGRKFTCLACSKRINPRGNCTLEADDRVTFNVREYVFCPAPRRTKGRTEPWCYDVWNQRMTDIGSPTWNERGNKGVWALFRRSRGEDW
ncbi:helix-turn-helix domain-containing protein [Nonomuraea bangladeshensis]|uniref:helix-turn-helix domain-containing protein n=1 Tax=Nonomuraea bangladeshensis TaxID=404385 RepID=UPI003C2AFBC5